MTKEHISTWFSYLCAGLQQAFLLILCVYYEIKIYLRSKRSEKYSRLMESKQSKKDYGTMDVETEEESVKKEE